MNERYDEYYKSRGYDRPGDSHLGPPVGYYDHRTSDHGMSRRAPYSGSGYTPSYDTPDYYDDRGGDRGMSHQGDGYFGPSYAGSYSANPYRNSNTSRFERGFNFETIPDRDGRGWWQKTRDEVARWLGDEDAERRRQIDERRQAMRGNRGKGPENYRRSDERIKDDISDLLWASDEVDASNMQVNVENGEVTLTGTLPSLYQKRCAVDIAESVWGVRNVMYLVRIENGEALDRSHNVS